MFPLSHLRIGIEKLVNKVVKGLSKLDELYINADVADKRRIICYLYPNKLQFDGEIYRTPKSNTVVDLILLINRKLNKNKKGKDVLFEPLSLVVARTGIEPQLRNL